MRVKLRRFAGGGLCVLLLTACTPSSPGESAAVPLEESLVSQSAITGTIKMPQGAALPRDAVVKVELRVPSAETGLPDPLVSQTLAATDGPPYEFKLSVPDGLEDTEGLVVFARVQSGPAILFNNLTGVPVEDADLPVSVPLTSTENWGTGGGTAGVTPELTLYDCAGTSVGIAIEAKAAFVSIRGGQTLTLPLLPGTDAGNRQFSNGKVVVQVTQDEYGAPTVSFAQGRAALLPCEK